MATIIKFYTPRRFNVFVISFLLVFWASVCIDQIGIHIPLIRQIFGFIFLSFLPGIMLLRILNINRLSITEVVLHSVGLSLSLLMGMAYVINSSYPSFGIAGPLSSQYLIHALGLISLVLYAFILRNHSEFEIVVESYVGFRPLLCITSVFLLMLALFGVYLMNYFHNNLFLMILFFIIALLIIFVSFNIVDRFYFPILIYFIGLALLLHVSLISDYIIGYDIQREYYFSQLILANSKWDSNINDPLAGIMSITLLPLVFSHICKIPLVWVFKLFYPILYSIISVGLYFIFRKFSSNLSSFYSCFYFISVPSFFYLMPQMARQEIGEIFLLSIILLICSDNVNPTKKKLLLVIYMLSLIVSHYAIDYLLLFLIILVWGYLIYLDLTDKPMVGAVITDRFVLLFAVSTLVWYMMVSSSVTFNQIVGMVDHIIGSLFTDFFDPDTTQGLIILVYAPESNINKILKYFYIISYFFIATGVLQIIIHKKNLVQQSEFCLLSMASFFILVAAIIVPNFSIRINTVRLIHISLFFLAPFFVFGVKSAFCMITFNRFPNINKKIAQNHYHLAAIFLAIFFLLNSGIFQDITNEPYLSSVSLNFSNDGPRFSTSEVAGANWISNRYNHGTIFALDDNRWVLLNSVVGIHNSKRIKTEEEFSLILPANSYLFQGIYNIKNNIKIVGANAKIYENGCRIFFEPN